MTTPATSYDSTRIDKIFSADVFSRGVMRQRLPKEVFRACCAPSITASRSTRRWPTSWPPR